MEADAADFQQSLEGSVTSAGASRRPLNFTVRCRR